MSSAVCSYQESIDEKYILTSDGVKVHIIDSKPDFRVTAVASKNHELQTASESVGVTGGWGDLFREQSAEELAEKTARLAVDLLSAKYPKGERAWVVLDPAILGLLSHEPIGHTVEADFVLSASIAKDKIGQKVASELITLVDSGHSQINPNASGTVLVDDEAVPAQRTVVIAHGVLRSYLHNPESAYIFGVAPTGNARTWSYWFIVGILLLICRGRACPCPINELISGIKQARFKLAQMNRARHHG